jgi:hypothetical protein
MLIARVSSRAAGTNNRWDLKWAEQEPEMKSTELEVKLR